MILYLKTQEKLKKFCTFEEQIEKIKEKGFRVSDSTKCLHFLKRVNYYNISGYFHYFDFKPKSNLDFEKILKIYEFDQKLRNLIFYMVEEIELYLRTQLSYFYAYKYNPLGYLNENNFNSKHHNHKKFLDMIENHKQKNIKNPIINHHIKNYEGKFPIWVIIEFFTIGELVHFYKDMKTADKKQLIEKFLNLDTSFQYVDSWLKCITDIRNRCAHSSRLYFFNFYNLPKLPQKLKKFQNDRLLFSQILAMKLIYSSNKNRFNKLFVNPLSQLIEKYKCYGCIDIEDIGFPEDWFEILVMR